MQGIEIRDLRVDYGDFTAVRNLTMDIGRGEIYGLVGPNGAGKTSTLNVLATLLLPTYGHVRIAGHDLEEEPDAVRARLGYMPDLAPIIKDLKVWEFLDVFAASYGMEGKERSSRIQECLELTGMQDKRDVYCGTLSRGMTQRVVLAKTLLHRPEVLLLDEPASGMDPLARIELKDALQAVAAEGATVVVSSHILSELAEMATSIGILHKGTLRHHGPVNQVLASLENASCLIEIDIVGDREACRLWLQNKGFAVKLPERHAQRLEIELSGDSNAQAEFLQSIVAAGFPVFRYQPRASSLEDLMRAISAS